MSLIPQGTGGGALKQEKTVTAGTSDIVATPDKGKLFSKVTVKPTPTEEKTITPTKDPQIIVPGSGKHLSKVTVDGSAELVPENIVEGKNIFGIEGSFDGVKINGKIKSLKVSGDSESIAKGDFVSYKTTSPVIGDNWTNPFENAIGNENQTMLINDTHILLVKGTQTGKYDNASFAYSVYRYSGINSALTQVSSGAIKKKDGTNFELTSGSKINEYAILCRVDKTHAVVFFRNGAFVIEVNANLTNVSVVGEGVILNESANMNPEKTLLLEDGNVVLGYTDVGPGYWFSQALLLRINSASWEISILSRGNGMSVSNTSVSSLFLCVLGDGRVLMASGTMTIGAKVQIQCYSISEKSIVTSYAGLIDDSEYDVYGLIPIGSNKAFCIHGNSREVSYNSSGIGGTASLIEFGETAMKLIKQADINGDNAGVAGVSLIAHPNGNLFGFVVGDSVPYGGIESSETDNGSLLLFEISENDFSFYSTKMNQLLEGDKVSFNEIASNVYVISKYRRGNYGVYSKLSSFTAMLDASVIKGYGSNILGVALENGSGGNTINVMVSP